MPFAKSSRTFALIRRPDKGALVFVLIALIFGAVTAVAGGLVSAMLLLALVAAGFTLWRYHIGLWLLVLLLPLSATAIFPRELFGITGANPYNALFALTVLSFLVDRMGKQKSYRRIGYPRFWWAYLMPVLLATAVGMLHFSEIPAFAFSQELIRFTSLSGYVRDVLIKPLTYVVLALLLGTAGRDGMKPDRVIVALCLSIWLFAAWVSAYVLLNQIGLTQLASATSRESLSGTGLHANDLGLLAACMLTLMVFAISGRDNTPMQRGIYFITLGIAGALLLISFSRGAFLAFAVGMMVYFAAQRRLGRVVIAVAVLVLLLPLLPVELYQRLSTGLNTGGSMVLYSSDDPLTAGRVAGVWLPLLSEVEAHPFFGNGLLSIAWSLPFRSGSLGLLTINTHNLYLKILLELGVVGLVLVVLFFVDLWRRFRVAAGNPQTLPHIGWLFDGAAAALLGYAVFGFTGGDYLPDPSNSWLWIVWGLLLAAPADVKRQRSLQAGGVRSERSGI